MNCLFNKPFLILLTSGCLLACTPDSNQPTPNKTHPIEESANPHLIDSDSVKKPASSSIKETPQEAKVQPEKPLDLSWDNTMPAPQIHQQHLLPNLFEEKKPLKNRASVGGKVYRNDDPTMPLMDSVEGAEVSVNVLIP